MVMYTMNGIFNFEGLKMGINVKDKDGHVKLREWNLMLVVISTIHHLFI